MSVAIPIPLLQHLPDVNVTPAVGVDEYALTYDHGTASFVLRAPAAPFAGILATGATVGATAQAQAFTLGVVSPFIAPAADSTTAWQVRKADGTTPIVTVDTTNARVGIGTAAPGAKLQIGASSGGSGVLPTNAMMWISSAGGNSSTVPAGRFDISMVDANPDYSTYIGTLNVDYGSTPAIGVLGTRNAAFDFPTLYLKSGNVGIGTTSPATTLHVVGAATITAGIRPAADSTTALQLQTAAGTSVLNVDTTNGYVGIGTSAPAAKLHLYDENEGTGNVEILRLQTNYNANGAQRALTWYDGNYITGQIDTRFNGTTIDMFFGHFYSSGYKTSDLVTIKGNGLVGINDTAPAEALDVTGNINTTGVYKVDDVQVLSNRVIDARCADVANSGDATTDGLIDALRDAMIAHGLIAASA